MFFVLRLLLENFLVPNYWIVSVQFLCLLLKLLTTGLHSSSIRHLSLSLLSCRHYLRRCVFLRSRWQRLIRSKLSKQQLLQMRMLVFCRQVLSRCQSSHICHEMLTLFNLWRRRWLPHLKVVSEYSTGFKFLLLFKRLRRWFFCETRMWRI